MIKIIAAVSENGVIGVNNSLPFHYPEDLKHFKQSTVNQTIIMGRKTFESLGSKPLPNRKNIVITKNSIDNIECCSSISQAINKYNQDVWLIGGYQVFQEGMNVANEIVLTITSDYITAPNAVTFPWINPLKFKINQVSNLGENNLKIVRYIKIL